MRLVLFLFLKLEDVVDVIGEVDVKIFLVLDFVSGFWQILMDLFIKYKVVFIMYMGIYEWI